MNNTNNLDSFFSYVSKAVIIIPIFIFVVSLFLKFGQTKTDLINSKAGLINQTPTTTIITPSTTNKIPIDLIGPWVCHYQEGQRQYDLSINNKKVILQVKENNQTKKYDLSSYVPFAEGLLNTDIGNIQNMVNQYSGQKIDVKKALSSCKKGT